MVLPIIAPATLLLISGLIRVIAWASSIIFVGMYARDAITKTKEADITLSNNDTVNDIINNPDLTAEQKAALLNTFINNIKTGTDWGTIALYGIGILAGAYIITSMMKNGK